MVYSSAFPQNALLPIIQFILHEKTQIAFIFHKVPNKRWKNGRYAYRFGDIAFFAIIKECLQLQFIDGLDGI